MVQGGTIVIAQLDEDAFPWIVDFLNRYSSAEARLADASLMYLAEREGIDAVFTLDCRDFSIFRTADGRAVRIIPD